MKTLEIACEKGYYIVTEHNRGISDHIDLDLYILRSMSNDIEVDKVSLIKSDLISIYFK